MKPQCLDVAGWRIYTNEEMREYMAILSQSAKGWNKKRRFGSILAVRNQLRPVDIYSYLRARFGSPNGFQTFLCKDDSDNLFHWDFNIKAGNSDVYIVGATRETHIHVSEKLTDKQWKILIDNIKGDFGRLGRAKAECVRKFEKWIVFQNKFAILADTCAGLHEAIVDAPPYEEYRASSRSKRKSQSAEKFAKRVSDRAAALYGNCLKLRLLTPIMAESFINLFILTFCKSEIKSDAEAYATFIRSKIPERISLLHKHCRLVAKPVDIDTEAYRNFLRMINKRNDLIHGNMDPEQEQLEVVYFEGKRPLLFETGDHVGKFFERLEKVYDPKDVVMDYENTHDFLRDIMASLEPYAYEYFENVMSDSYPGYEVRQKRVTRLFPSYVFTGTMQGVRYDDELNIKW